MKGFIKMIKKMESDFTAGLAALHIEGCLQMISLMELDKSIELKISQKAKANRKIIDFTPRLHSKINKKINYKHSDKP